MDFGDANPNSIQGAATPFPTGISAPLKVLLKCEFIALFSLIFPGQSPPQPGPGAPCGPSPWSLRWVGALEELNPPAPVLAPTLDALNEPGTAETHH